MTALHECELILAVTDAEKLQQVPGSAVWKGLTLRFQSNTRLTDIYWDTPDYALTRAGWAVRLRFSGKDAKLQAKSLHATDSAGVNLRQEYTQRARLNFGGLLSTLDVGPVSLLISQALQKPILDIELTPLFAATRMRRTYKILANPLAYLMLDTGAIHRAGDSAPQLGAELASFYRFELEGDPAAREQLLGWAHGLCAELGAEITPTSKFELAWQALKLPEDLLALAHAAAERHPVPESPAEPAASVPAPAMAESSAPAVNHAADTTPTATTAAVPEPPSDTAPPSAPTSAAETVPEAASQPAASAMSTVRLQGSAAAAVAAAMQEYDAAARREAAAPRRGKKSTPPPRSDRPAAAPTSPTETSGAGLQIELHTAPHAADSLVPGLPIVPPPPTIDHLANTIIQRNPNAAGLHAGIKPQAVGQPGFLPPPPTSATAAPATGDGLPPVIAHADLGRSLIITAEPIDKVLDDACHDPLTGELRPLEEWPIEFRENCLRRDPPADPDFVSQLGRLVRQTPAPNTPSDAIMRAAAALFDVTTSIHKLEPRFRPLLLTIAHLAGADLPAFGKGAQRWLGLRDRLIYHGLPDFDGRQSWILGLALAGQSRDHRDISAPAWRRLPYDDRQDALRLSALLKFARDFAAEAGADWVPAHIDLRHGEHTLTVEAVGSERRLPLKTAGKFWRLVFGESLPLRRRSKNDHPAPAQPRIKFRPLDRKQRIDLFCGQNTGAAIQEILAYQSGIFTKQDRRLRECRNAEPARTIDAFLQDPLIEILHDYRVALRRLRSYCRLFEMPLGRKPVRKMTAPMQALAEPTAELRAIDVLIETIHNDALAGCFRTHAGGEPDLLIGWLLERRLDHLARFWPLLEGSQTLALRERLFAQLKPERWCWTDRFGPARSRRAGDSEDFNPIRQGDYGRSRRAQQTPIEIYAAQAMMESLAEARVLYQAARPDPLHCPIGDLHAVRIALKKLRYAFELFAPLMGDPTNNSLPVCKRLQDQLGEINDSEGNCRVLETLLATEPPVADAPTSESTPPTGLLPIRAAAEIWLAYSHKRVYEIRLRLIETWPRLFAPPVVQGLQTDWWS